MTVKGPSLPLGKVDSLWQGRSCRTRRRAAVPSGRRQRIARNTLRLDDILDGALAIIRRDGLDELSMKRLADELDCGVMSVYRYVQTKDDLLSAVAVRVAEDLYDDHVDAPAAHWEEEIRGHYLAVRRSLRRHQGLAELLLLRDETLQFHVRARDQVLGHVERHLRALRVAGFSADDAVRLFYGLSYWTVAFVARETGQNGPEPGGGRLNPGRWVLDLPERFSTLRQGGQAVKSLASDEQFVFMLDTFLRGAHARLPSAEIPPDGGEPQPGGR